MKIFSLILICGSGTLFSSVVFLSLITEHKNNYEVDLKEIKKQTNQVICYIIEKYSIIYIKNLQLCKIKQLIPVNFILKFKQ